MLKIRQAKPHRVLLLDELAKHGILGGSKSLFSCIDNNNVLQESLDAVGAKHYTFGKVCNQPEIVENGDLYAEQPPGWKSCFLDVVAETSDTSRFITEKTVWPIADQMPFVIQGAQYINHDLRKLGFEIFDELIDYKFDTLNNPRDRTVELAKELKRLHELDLDYDKVYEELWPKIKHNLCRLMELYHNDEYMPAVIKKYGHRIYEQTTPVHQDFWYVDPIQGSWLAYIDSDGRNQQAVDLIRDVPYLANMYRNRL